MPKPLVALVGRPNVGKSTLFNRLIGQRKAIVEDVPGTTRDRLYADSEWNGVSFTVIDTGGLMLDVPEEDVMGQVRQQAKIAIAEADVVVLLADVKEGLTPADHEVAQLLRRSEKPVILAANKADNQQRRMDAVEFYELGLGEPFPISAIHGTGTGDLLDEVVAALPRQEEEPEPEIPRIAIVGRPNVGKSSLLNALLGRERAIVHREPGTTRDAVDTTMEWGGEAVILIDTAGIRRRGRVNRGIERYSVLRALRAIQRCDVAVLLLDATQGIAAQDAHIGGYIVEENKGVVIAVNKWDLVEEEQERLPEFVDFVHEELKFLSWAPVLFTSALTRKRVDDVMETALRVREERFKRVSTSRLNEFLNEVTARHAPPSKGGRRLRIYYATQPAVDPPTFVFFVNNPKLMHFSYERYLENQLRAEFGFEGTPLRLRFRKRS